MKRLFLLSASLLMFAAATVQAQGLVRNQGPATGQEKATQALPNAVAAYTKWRDDSLPKYSQREQTPHYAVSIVAQRLDNNTAQVEMLVAAEMKRYTITIQPVRLRRQASGEVLTEAVGKPIVIEQKAGRKFRTEADTVRIGDTTTQVPISRLVEALEITWSPKNDTAEDPSNTCLVRLGKEPTVVVNGYIIGEPVR